MSELKTFLKVLSKVGYPNPEVASIAKMIDYNLEEFLPDLVAEIGEEKADEFTEKAIEKLGGEKGIKVTFDDPNEYAYIKLYNPRLDLDNDEGTVLCDWGWGKTNLQYVDEEENESYQTIEYIESQADMGDWGDLDEEIDYIKDLCSKEVHQNCGFGIWFDDQMRNK